MKKDIYRKLIYELLFSYRRVIYKYISTSIYKIAYPLVQAASRRYRSSENDVSRVEAPADTNRKLWCLLFEDVWSQSQWAMRNVLRESSLVCEKSQSLSLVITPYVTRYSTKSRSTQLNFFFLCLFIIYKYDIVCPASLSLERTQYVLHDEDCTPCWRFEKDLVIFIVSKRHPILRTDCGGPSSMYN